MKTNVNAYENVNDLEKTLSVLVTDGILTEDDAEKSLAKERSKAEKKHAKDIERRLADVHDAPITKGSGKDHRWKTRITDSDGATHQIAKTRLKDLEKALYWHYYKVLPPSGNSNDTISTLFPVYVEKQLKRGRSEATIVRYKKDWKNHCSDCSFIDQPVSEVTVDELESWALSLVGDKKMRRTNYYNITVIIRGILEIAVKRNLIRRNPWDYVDPGNLRSTDERRKHEQSAEDLETASGEILTASEMTDLRDYGWEILESNAVIKNPFEILAVLFTLEHGLRVGELCALKHSDVVGDGTIHVRRMLCDQGRECRKILHYTKGYQDRKIPLTESSKAVLEYARKLQKDLGIESDYIFSENCDPLTYRSPGRALDIMCRKLHIAHKSIHNIRKTVTTVLVDSKMFPPATISKIMGNSVEVIIRHYYYNREDIDSICSKYDSALAGLFLEEDPEER